MPREYLDPERARQREARRHAIIVEVGGSDHARVIALRALREGARRPVPPRLARGFAAGADLGLERAEAHGGRVHLQLDPSVLRR